MTSNAQPSGSDSADHAHEHEALLLVELLRTSRLSLLYAEPGSNKTALLTSGLMPLLCRRAGDQVVPAAVRTSGVVVPFPDRRSRPSPRSGKRRREIVVYCSDWTETPLAALRESIYRAVAATPAQRVEPSARLSEVLENLSQRFDANFLVLLDRFEDLLTDSHPEPRQLLNELAEAVNQVQLPANFLISLTDEARPRLGALRTRIPGFDDFSLKLAPPRDFEGAAASTGLGEQVRPTVIGALPVLTEALTLPPESATPPRPAGLRPVLRSPGMAKVRRMPRARLQVTVEDVYAMIEAALSRIAMSTADAFFPADPRKGPEPHTGDAGALEPTAAQDNLTVVPASRTPTRGKNLEAAIERMERRLGVSRTNKTES